MNLDFGIALYTDSKAYKKAPLVRSLSDELEEYLKNQDYGTGVCCFLIGFICQEAVPGFEAFQKARKPRFVNEGTVKLITGGTKKIYKVFSYDMKMDDDTYNAYVNASDEVSLKLLAQQIVNSLENVDKLPKRVKDFDREKFKSDVRSYLEKI